MKDNHLLDALTREGMLVSVSVRYWRAARKLHRLDTGIRNLADEARRLARSDATEIVERFGQLGCASSRSQLEARQRPGRAGGGFERPKLVRPSFQEISNSFRRSA